MAVLIAIWSLLRKKKFYAITSVACLLLSTIGFSLAATLFEFHIKEERANYEQIRRAQDGANKEIRVSESTLQFGINYVNTAMTLEALGRSDLAENRRETATKLIRQSAVMAASAIENTSESWISQKDSKKKFSPEYKARLKDIKQITNYADLMTKRDEFVKIAVKGIGRLTQDYYEYSDSIARLESKRSALWSYLIAIQLLGLTLGLVVSIFKKNEKNEKD